MMHSDEYKIITGDMERLRDEVMRRVKFVRFIRAFIASPAMSAGLAFVFVLCSSIFVSFNDVISNIMLHGEWGSRFSYAYSSIINARIAVQIFAVLTSVSLFALSIKLLFRLRTPVNILGNFIASRSPLKFFRS